VRGWLRAGGTLSWNDELVLQPGSLEKQIGIGGPLILAASSEGNVSFRLDDPTAVLLDSEATAPAERKQPEVNDPGTTEFSVSDKVDSRPVPVPDSTAEKSAAGGYSLKVNVDWVYVNASVRDRYTNRAVPDLQKKDFELYENGSLQLIERFESTEAPFSLLLLLDVSGSTKSYLSLIQNASVQFAREIKSNDRMAVATFNSQTRLIQDFTNDRSQIEEAIRRIRSGGGTAFYDALYRSVRDYMDGVEGRKAIVVFSDGVDNQLTGDFGSGSQTIFPDLYREIQEADTLIYTIFLDTEGRQGIRRTGMGRGGLGGILGDIIFGGPTIGIPGGGLGDEEAYAQARRELELIADQTGGRMYSPRKTSDLVNVYSEIANDLRVQYTLGYYSHSAGNNGEWREIEVKVIDRTDLAVRARRGYYGRTGFR